MKPLSTVILVRKDLSSSRSPADPKHLGARIGVLAVLHTWGQKLNLHPHLHCIVPVVYCKPPFGSPEQVLAYLARYTHRVAISNQRLVSIEAEEVTFTWRNYAQGDRLREMTLSGEEFLGRFLLHVLPDRFVRIRYYGLLANRHREQALALCRELLPGRPERPRLTKSDWQSLIKSLTGIDPLQCEACGQKALHLVGKLPPLAEPRREKPRAPPL